MQTEATAGAGQDDSCKGLSELSHADIDEIRKAIRDKYAEVALSASGKFAYPTGKEGALALGYDAVILDSLSPASLESFCGVGNPFALGPVRPGDAVLDYGCGAGLDLIVAARMTGPDGRVVGVDLTDDMVRKAKENAAAAGICTVEVRRVSSERLPCDGAAFDVVTSNGVINLSPCKQTCFEEIFRVLKPGGRLQFADVMREDEASGSVAGSVEAWSQ